MAGLGVYVDGYNVYYRSLKDRGPRFKWLDRALVQRKFKGHTVSRLVYCTARVSDQAIAARQDRYLREGAARPQKRRSANKAVRLDGPQGMPISVQGRGWQGRN